MALRNIFKTGSAVVCALPKPFREALRLFPGTQVIVTLQDRRIIIEKAVVMTEAQMGAPVADADLARFPRKG